ncbi:MAG: hypothetical protein WA790_07490 [Sulfitobacter sp.]
MKFKKASQITAVPFLMRPTPQFFLANKYSRGSPQDGGWPPSFLTKKGDTKVPPLLKIDDQIGN